MVAPDDAVGLLKWDPIGERYIEAGWAHRRHRDEADRADD
jgi:hypothetical protein